MMIDGGITLGTDVVKALACGAEMVFMGRPILWGLAVNGEEGVAHVLQLIKEELESTMIQCRDSALTDIGRDMVVHSSQYK